MSGDDFLVRRQGSDYSLSWVGNRADLLEVYPSLSPTEYSAAGDRRALIDAGLSFALDDPGRHFFHCVDPSGEVVVAAERHLSLEGTPNFRDYGGYRTMDGRQIQWGKLYRSGYLSALTSADQRYFTGLDIRLVCDFRRDQERLDDPSRLPVAASMKVVGLPITPGSSDSFFENVAKGNVSSEEMADFMCSINQEFVLDQVDAYRQMFHHLLNLDKGASLVHCAAGKDRTGFAAAVVLAALGVPRSTILSDYMLTARCLNVDAEIGRISEKYQWGGAADVMRPMLEVRESYLQSAFATIDQHFSSVEEYLKESLGIGSAERELLADRYLI